MDAIGKNEQDASAMDWWTAVPMDLPYWAEGTTQ